MLKYSTFSSKNSMYNTPPCFGVYTIQLVLKWVEETVGGLEKMEAINRKKADILYSFMDSGDFYRATADADSRSLMNVTFRLPSENLEKTFVQKALENELGGLKGHRSVGGCRASIYNAMPEAGIGQRLDQVPGRVEAAGRVAVQGPGDGPHHMSRLTGGDVIHPGGLAEQDRRAANIRAKLDQPMHRDQRRRRHQRGEDGEQHAATANPEGGRDERRAEAGDNQRTSYRPAQPGMKRSLDHYPP